MFNFSKIKWDFAKKKLNDIIRKILKVLKIAKKICLLMNKKQ